MQTRTVNSNHLTSECWSVQFFGTDYCKKCEFKDTPECGGVKISETGRNGKDQRVPLGET